MRCLRFSLALLPAVLLSAGCSSGNPNTPARIKGSIKYKGQPITAGQVRLVSKDGGGAGKGDIKADGTYAVNELPVGEMTIIVDTEVANPNPEKKEYKGGDGKNVMPTYAPPGAGEYERKKLAKAGVGSYTKIPAKYADPAKSGLSHTLVKGDNTKDIDLTD